MKSGDKEEILEAIGVFAEHVDQRFVGIDQEFKSIGQRFESIDRRFESIDRRFESIDRRFQKIDQRFEKIDNRFDVVMNTLDWLVGHAKKHDEEMLMMSRGMRRMSDDIDKIKPLVGLKT